MEATLRPRKGSRRMLIDRTSSAAAGVPPHEAWDGSAPPCPTALP